MDTKDTTEQDVDSPAANGVHSSLLHVEIIETAQDENTTTVCSRLGYCFQTCTKPCLAKSHPLPQNAGCCRKFLDNFLCPPHSRMAAIIFVVCFSSSAWAALYSVTDTEALPGGNLFSLLVLFIACWCGGYLVGLVRLPPLLGMLLVGGALGNVPYIKVAKDIDPTWSSSLRQIALTIILTRAGLGLDPQALRRLSFVVVRLAFLPCLAETLVDGIACHLILGFPWPWGFMLGFVIAAVSPAVVVPSLLGLSYRGYGIDKGIPTLIIAAASVDDVLAITGFGVLFGISFSSGNIVWTLFKGPLEACVGVACGVIGGILMWYIPQRSSKYHLLFRSTLLMCLSLMFLFGSNKLHWAGAGPLASLTLPFVAALRWRSEFQNDEQNPVDDVVGILWMLFQPLLFGLIGAEVDVTSLEVSLVGLGIAVLGIGLVFRMLVSFLSVFGTDLTLRERFFIPFAWLPKATVQAAIGAVALDTAMAKGDTDLMNLGKQILNLAVLSIILTAPLGSLLIAILGPLLLKKSSTFRDSILVIPNDDDQEAGREVAENEKMRESVREDVEKTSSSLSHH
ncbi:hypothetical protein BsWGS_06729 [Bradybaena similaris]